MYSRFQLLNNKSNFLQEVQVCQGVPYCPLSSAICNATLRTLPLFEMAESASLPRYVLHYLLFIKFISVFYHLCVTGQLL
jgi:hypothetical protein